MLGVQLLGNQKVTVKEYPAPIAEGNKVLIRIKDSAICGSEMHGFRGEKENPFNGGHEAAGEVIDPGDSRRLSAGDRVGIHAVVGCGDCRWCAVGKYTFCENRSGCPGTHAELLVVADHACLKLPNDVPYDVGVLLSGDGLGVPYHVNKRLGTRGGEFVCVVGVGPIGLGNTLVQSFVGGEVIAIDVNDYRLELAKELGAAHTINSRSTDPIDAVREITQGMMADKCIEAAGKSETFRLALRCAGKNGTVMAVGEQGETTISPSEDLIRRDITLMGSWFYHYCEYPEMLDLYRRGLSVAKLITDHFPLSQAQEAFDKFAQGKAGKVMLEP